MKIQYLVASMTVAAVLVAPSAYCAPGGGTQVTHYLTRQAYVSGYANVGNTYNYFSGQVYDDMNGVAQGSVYSQSYDDNTYTYSFISCSGPAYANAVSVKGNGRSAVNATLDPNSPDCYSYNLFAPITVTADGQFDGNYASSNNGNGKSTYGGATYKYNTKSDSWSQTFTADNGFYSGTYTGDASIYQNNERQRLK